jgi:putative ABC transport system substrate-binding protein
MKRREFITLLGGAAIAWPLAAQAQQAERVRRIGVLLPTSADDAEYQARVGAFLQALALLGWTIGRNVRIDTRWAAVPIVFVNVADPVGGGFVDSLARPATNATGFMTFEYSISGKWLELLKQIAPGVTRVAVLRDPAQPSGTGQFGVIQGMASSLRVEVSPVNVRDADETQWAVRPLGAPRMAA